MEWSVELPRTKVVLASLGALATGIYLFSPSQPETLENKTVVLYETSPEQQEQYSLNTHYQTEPTIGTQKQLINTQHNQNTANATLSASAAIIQNIGPRNPSLIPTYLDALEQRPAIATLLQDVAAHYTNNNVDQATEKRLVEVMATSQYPEQIIAIGWYRFSRRYPGRMF